MINITRSIILFLLFFGSNALSDSYIIGGTELNIPSPEGYVRVTSDMETVYRYLMQLKDPQNDVLSYFIPEEDMPAAMEGELPKLDKYFILKVNKVLKTATLSPKDFAELQQVTRKQNKEIFDSIESKLPDQFETISKGISDEFDIDFAMKVSQIVPLDIHYTDNNMLAYSMFLNYGVVAEGSNENVIVSATATFLSTAGKVIFLYSYAPKDEVEWTRSVSKLWAESILAMNPSPPTHSSGYNRFNWQKVLRKCVVGAIAGGLSAFVLVFLKKRKRAG